jgi:methylated-DNA-protein-cysteine methyltransferase-like protein
MAKGDQNDFYERVSEVTAQIPKGKVTTYGAIARYLGLASGARLVGYALNGASKSNIPAHRVLNRLGQLTGRAHFPDDTMRERLQQEGVRFVAEYTVDIERYFWDPEELRKTKDAK